MSTDDWCTGPEVCDLNDEFFDGPVDFDPFSNERSIVRARKMLTAGALHVKWPGRTWWDNPPYSNLLECTIYALEQYSTLYHGQQKELLMLVPVATSTEWHRRATDGVVMRRGVIKPSLIFTHRLKFIDELGKVADSARFDSLLMYFGPRHQRFHEVYEPLCSWRVMAPFQNQSYELMAA